MTSTSLEQRWSWYFLPPLMAAKVIYASLYIQKSQPQTPSHSFYCTYSSNHWRCLYRKTISLKRRLNII